MSAVQNKPKVPGWCQEFIRYKPMQNMPKMLSIPVVTEIPRGSKYPKEYGPRCKKTVTSTGTSFFDGNKHQCGRLARFKFGGVDYCAQHAGEAALVFCIKNNPSEPTETAKPVKEG